MKKEKVAKRKGCHRILAFIKWSATHLTINNMRNLTLFQLFELFPIQIKGVAFRMGKSREWLSGLIYGRFYGNKQKKKQVLLEIENELHNLAKALLQIKLIDDETE